MKKKLKNVWDQKRPTGHKQNSTKKSKTATSTVLSSGIIKKILINKLTKCF